MTPEKHARMQEIFEIAVRLPAWQCHAYLEEACQGDADLRDHLLALLAADRETGEPPDFSDTALGEAGSKAEVLSAGTRLGPYVILNLIGKGATGHVYRARDTRLGRLVAIKVVNGRISNRFEREARLIASLRHPNICTLYDVGPNYLVMELLEGETLKDRLDRGRLPVDTVVDLGLQLADALGAAHSDNIVHRDIKPGNIFISGRGQATILDFGLAKLRVQRASFSFDSTRTMALDHSLTLQGVVIGTPPYMSPEQARGEEVDARSDIFSLGAVLYEMATGVRSFPGDTPTAVLRAVVRTDPVPPSALNPDLPAGLDRLIRKAMEKDQADRYQTAAEMRADLEQIRAAQHGLTEPVANVQPGWATRATQGLSRLYRIRWWSQSPWPLLLNFAGLAFLVLAGRNVFERTGAGQDFRQFESTILQTMLGIGHNPDYLPVIVNISPARKVGVPTDRALLDQLIRKLDVMQVRAIGIDVDFSPLDDGQPVTPEDWNYFHEWNQLAHDNGFELRLGVYRRTTDIPAHWLGLQEFVHLAAGIAAPSDDREYNFFSIRTPGSDRDGGGSLTPMSVALYDAAGGKPIAGRIVHADENDGLLRTARYRIDYSDSLLKLLSAQIIDYSGPQDLDIAEQARKIAFRGKVVLIGDSTAADDQFCRPFSVIPTSGLMAHAASLVTLRQGGLQDIGGDAAIWLDVAAIALVGVLLWVFHQWRKRPNHAASAAHASAAGTTNGSGGEGETATMIRGAPAASPAKGRLDLTGMSYCLFIAAATGAAGLAIVRTNRIFWPDFLWISGVLMIHPFVSETFFPFFGGLLREIGRMCRQVFSGSKGHTHAL